ncbi:MAG: MFS transporter [Oscillochloris sp.]|nr:MFS transporter [Oscillochloris sp.]
MGFAIDGGIYAVLLNLFLDRLSYTPEMIGTVNASGTLAFALASLPAGLLGERFGSRRVLIAGLWMMAAGALTLPFADLVPAGARLFWLIANTVVIYLGLALYFVNTAPLLLGLVRSDQQNQVYGAQTAVLSLAAFLGSLCGGFLPPLFGFLLGLSLDLPVAYRYALLVAGLAVVPAIIAAQGIRSPQSDESATVPVGTPGTIVVAPILGLLLLITLVRALQVSGIAVTSTYMNLYLDTQLNLPTAQIGLLLALGRLVAVPAALSTAALTARFGNRGVVIATSLATTLALLPLALIPHWGAAGLSFMLVTSLSWIRYAASIVFFLDLVPPNRRATVSGVTEMAAGICFTGLTFGGGYLIAAFSYQALFLLGAALTAVSALLFWIFFASVGGESRGRGGGGTRAGRAA